METMTMPEIKPASTVVENNEARYNLLHSFTTAALKQSNDGKLSKRILAIFNPPTKKAKILVDGSMLAEDFFAITDRANFTNEEKRRIVSEVQYATESEIALEACANNGTIGVNFPFFTVINF